MEKNLKKNIYIYIDVTSWTSVTSWTTAHKGSLSFTVSWSLLKSISIELVIPSNHLILCHSRLLLPSIFPSISDIYISLCCISESNT